MTKQATHRLRPLPHERMAQLIPALAEEVPRWVSLLRERGLGEAVLIDEPFGEHLPEAVDFIEEWARAKLQWEHGDWRRAVSEGDLLGSHLQFMVHHELHHRRTFWVDDSLAWMLADTELDAVGDLLRPPFPAFACVFVDDRTLDLAHRVYARFDAHDACRPKMLTAYVLAEPSRKGRRLVRLYLMMDAGRPRRWPLLIARDLWYGPEDDIATVLRSRRDDLDGPPDPFWTSPEVVDLVHLILNTVLYTTCSHFESIVRRSPLHAARSKLPERSRRRRKRRERRKAARQAARFSSESVFHLPGAIPIDRLRAQAAEAKGGGDGPTVTKRFMVRGHWRRANPSWTDQRVRWVEPYWKGPDMAATIERQYRLRGPAEESSSVDRPE